MEVLTMIEKSVPFEMFRRVGYPLLSRNKSVSSESNFSIRIPFWLVLWDLQDTLWA